MSDASEYQISMAGGDGDDLTATDNAYTAAVAGRGCWSRRLGGCAGSGECCPHGTGRERNTMNNEELAKIEARADAATDGPWEAGTLGGHAADVFTVDADGDLGRLVICEHAGIDASFIAHARTDVPALLALVRTQQANLARVMDLANNAGRCGWKLSADDVRKALGA